MFGKYEKKVTSIREHRELLDQDWQNVGNHALLEFYVKIMPKVIGAERCSIFIHDPVEEQIWLKAGTEVGEREIQLESADESMVGQVIASGKAMIFSELDGEEGYHSYSDRQTGFVTREVLCIPIMSLDGSQVTGAVQLLNKIDDGHFNESDQETLVQMAHYLELALENIFFHEEATQALASLRWVLSMVLYGSVTITLLFGLLIGGYWFSLS